MKHIKNLLKFEQQNDNVLETLNPAEEYIKDGDIYCKICDTPRTCFGITSQVRCICKCQSEAYSKRREIQQQIARQERINNLRLNSLLGEKYKDVTFNNTEIVDAQFERVFNRCKKYCEVADVVMERGIGIYLYGNKGTGKTRLTSCMANELMSNYYTIMFTNFSEISRTIRATFNGKGNEADFLHKLESVNFLFIDDFGTEVVSRNNEDLWLQEKIFDIVNNRYNNNKPIIFTSNYSLLEMLQNRGLADKTIDRINEMCESMKLEGKSYRIKTKQERVLPF